MMSHRNQAIEFFRAIACIFVVLIHARFPEPFGRWIIGAGRFAVPFFCLISGYYCNRNDTEASLSHISIHLKRMVVLTLSAAALAVVSNCIAGLISGDGCFAWIAGELRIKVLLRFLLFNRAVFLNSAMWYLFAMIYAYGILYFLVKTGVIRYALPFAFVLLTGNLVLCEFSGQAWYYGGNFLLEVLPFVVIGYHFDKFLKIRIPFASEIFLACAGCALAVWEVSVFYFDAPPVHRFDCLCGHGFPHMSGTSLGQGRHDFDLWLKTDDARVYTALLRHQNHACHPAGAVRYISLSTPGASCDNPPCHAVCTLC